MIPRAYITEWRSTAPWNQDSWVEQDLVISRAIVEIFRKQEIADKLAFRGGTALYKLYLQRAARYSEDIDLVQLQQEPIGATLDLIRMELDSWLGAPKREHKSDSVNLIYRFNPEGSPATSMRLKIEINTREHSSKSGITRMPFSVENRWFSDQAEVSTYQLHELLGTKLRALYQRKKGRDLFDLWFALKNEQVNPSLIVDCFIWYMAHEANPISRAQFEENLHNKSKDRAFRNDISPLLRPDIEWDFDNAVEVVMNQIISRLDGDPWKGLE